MLHKLASTTDIMVQTYIVPYDEVKTPHATRDCLPLVSLRSGY